MKICIKEDSLTQSSAGGITGCIYLNFGNLFFPERDWSDFPVVLIGWWINEFLMLQENGHCEFHFMDGPFSVKLNLTDKAGLHIECMYDDISEHAWSATISEVATELKVAAGNLLSFLQIRNFKTRDVEMLRQNLTLLTAGS